METASRNKPSGTRTVTQSDGWDVPQWGRHAEDVTFVQYLSRALCQPLENAGDPLRETGHIAHLHGELTSQNDGNTGWGRGKIKHSRFSSRVISTCILREGFLYYTQFWGVFVIFTFLSLCAEHKETLAKILMRITWTEADVTDILLGTTSMSTHWSSSTLKRFGSVHFSHASCLEHLKQTGKV